MSKLVELVQENIKKYIDEGADEYEATFKALNQEYEKFEKELNEFKLNLSKNGISNT